jgi:hypothetical protein
MALGIFVGLVEADLLAIRDIAVATLKSGAQIVDYTVPGASLTVKKFMLAHCANGVGPQTVLQEVRYALQRLDPTTYGRDASTTRTKASFGNSAPTSSTDLVA